MKKLSTHQYTLSLGSSLRTMLIVLVCFSFVITEIANAHQIISGTSIEWADVNSEGSESSEGEGKEDKSEKKSKDKYTNQNSICISAIHSLLIWNGYHLANYIPDDFQEIPQPPPEV